MSIFNEQVDIGNVKFGVYMLFYLSVVSIFALGYLAQTTGLCMVRGVKQAIDGKPMFLISILFSGSLAWVSMGAGEWIPTKGGVDAYWPSIYSFTGGLLFGVGASFNGGCGVSTVSRFARGELVMGTTVLGWLVGWILFLPLLSFPEARSEMDLLNGYQYLVLIPLTLLLGVVIFRMPKGKQRLWLSMLGIGLMAGFVFVTEPHWTPSSLLKSISMSVWYQDESVWPELSRFILIAALLIGMVTAALITKSFELRWFKLTGVVKHLCAGVLMGCGAVMANGGNDTQLLVAMPALSLAGYASVASIIAGIYVGLRVSSR